MFRHILTRKLAGAFAAAGVLAIAQLSGPALVTASPSIEHVDYPADVVTNTNLTLDKYKVNPGQKNTATAKVSSGAGTPTGTVTFSVAGHSATVTLKPNGTASWDLPRDLQAGNTYQVTAQYNGAGVYKPSSDTAYVTVRERGNGKVRGNDGSQGGNSGAEGGSGANGGNGGNGGGKGRPAPTTGNGGGVAGEQATGGLPGTGSDSSTMLYGVGGLVLLGAGGVALALNRRKHHA